MLFNSFSFLVFLSLTLAVFAACPVRLRWAWLLLASVLFYGWLAPANLVFLAAVAATALLTGRGLHHAAQPWRRRAWLSLGLLLILGSLAAFKLYDFCAGQVELLLHWRTHALPRLGLTAPAGYSFYAFSAASYLIDAYVRHARAGGETGIGYAGARPGIDYGETRPAGDAHPDSHGGTMPGTASAGIASASIASASIASASIASGSAAWGSIASGSIASIGSLALYIAWFPKILAGPIERAGHFLPQLSGGLRRDPAALVPALQLIAWGLFKKVVIADNLAPVVDHGFAIPAYATPVDLLLAVYFFAFQIYCDFSGYTDIAIGVSQLFGLRLAENFRRPYLAVSTAEFWSKRWHISLATWFRDYLFIPLGGSQVCLVRRYLNIMLVFAVSGLWHAGLGYGVGWTFLVWGALNGLYQWIGIATGGAWRRLGTRLPWLRDSRLLRIGRSVLTFHLVLLAWVFFRARSVPDAMLILRRLGSTLAALPAQLAAFPYTAGQITGVALILLLLGCEILDERRPLSQRLAGLNRPLRWGVYYAGIFALLLLGRWQAREFIYMQF
jgi:D-alanyl-lipoteichoic acid acyltransferase DltB (MBOAT superfamily)